MSDNSKRIAGTRTSEENPRYLCHQCDVDFDIEGACPECGENDHVEEFQRRTEERRRTLDKYNSGERLLIEMQPCPAFGPEGEDAGTDYRPLLKQEAQERMDSDRRGPDKRKPLPREGE